MKGPRALQRVTDVTPIRLTAFEDVFDRVQEIYDSIARRAFEMFEGRGCLHGYDMEDWLKAESEFLRPVNLEVAESNDAIAVRVEVPGFSPNELEASIEPRRLTITGKRQVKEEQKKGKTVYREQSGDQFLRVVDLPAEVASAKTAATLKDGILEITLRKLAPAKKVTVEVKAA